MVTVGLFGSDNTMPGLVGPHVISQNLGATLAPFEHTCVNGMLQLNGRKCSTSQNHGIWIYAVQESGLLTSDELRFALARCPLDQGHTNLDTDEIADGANTLREWSNVHFRRAVSALRRRGQFELPARGWQLLAAQCQALEPGALDLQAATGALISAMAEVREDATLLPVLAVMLEPIAPGTAARVWAAVGRRGAPCVSLLRGAFEVGSEWDAVGPASSIAADALDALPKGAPVPQRRERTGCGS